MYVDVIGSAYTMVYMMAHTEKYVFSHFYRKQGDMPESESILGLVGVTRS